MMTDTITPQEYRETAAAMPRDVAAGYADV